MEKIENREFADETIMLDGHHYVDCVFNNCTFVFHGGDYGFHNIIYNKNCRFAFGGPASRTFELLSMLGFLKSGIPAQNAPYGVI